MVEIEVDSCGGDPNARRQGRRIKANVEKGIVESEPNGYFIGDLFFARYVRS